MRSVPATGALRSKVDRALALRDAAQERLEGTKSEIKRLENQEARFGLVAELFRKLIDMEVTTGVKAVEDLQSRGLQSVFTDQDLQVEAEVSVQRGKVSVDLATIHKRDDGLVVRGQSIDGFGGSVTTVQSVLLRVIVIIRRGLRPLLLLDEALPAFDSNYIVNVGKFLQALCKRVGLDILMVTQNIPLADSVGNGYRIVGRPNGAVFERLQ